LKSTVELLLVVLLSVFCANTAIVEMQKNTKQSENDFFIIKNFSKIIQFIDKTK